MRLLTYTFLSDCSWVASIRNPRIIRPTIPGNIFHRSASAGMILKAECPKLLSIYCIIPEREKSEGCTAEYQTAQTSRPAMGETNWVMEPRDTPAKTSRFHTHYSTLFRTITATIGWSAGPCSITQQHYSTLLSRIAACPITWHQTPRLSTWDIHVWLAAVTNGAWMTPGGCLLAQTEWLMPSILHSDCPPTNNKLLPSETNKPTTKPTTNIGANPPEPQENPGTCFENLLAVVSNI